MCDDEFERLNRIRAVGGLPRPGLPRLALNAEIRAAGQAQRARAEHNRALTRAQDIARARHAVLEEYEANCDFPLSQDFSLRDASRLVRGGVCWAMSFDWAVRTVRDQQPGGRHFHRISQRLRLIQMILNRTPRQDEFLERIARAMGLHFTPVQRGDCPAVGHAGTPELEMMRDIARVACLPRENDPHGVRMLGFNDAGGARGHEIALRVNGPWQVFDPNFGQFTFENDVRMILFVAHLFNNCYQHIAVQWDLCIVSQGEPLRLDGGPTRRVVPTPPEAGAPEPVHRPPPSAPTPQDAQVAARLRYGPDAIGEAMLAYLVGDATPEQIRILVETGEREADEDGPP